MQKYITKIVQADVGYGNHGYVIVKDDNEKYNIIIFDLGDNTNVLEKLKEDVENIKKEDPIHVTIILSNLNNHYTSGIEWLNKLINKNILAVDKIITPKEGLYNQNEYIELIQNENILIEEKYESDSYTQEEEIYGIHTKFFLFNHNERIEPKNEIEEELIRDQQNHFNLITMCYDDYGMSYLNLGNDNSLEEYQIMMNKEKCYGLLTNLGNYGAYTSNSMEFMKYISENAKKDNINVVFAVSCDNYDREQYSKGENSVENKAKTLQIPVLYTSDGTIEIYKDETKQIYIKHPFIEKIIFKEMDKRIDDGNIEQLKQLLDIKRKGFKFEVIKLASGYTINS